MNISLLHASGLCASYKTHFNNSFLKLTESA